MQNQNMRSRVKKITYLDSEFFSTISLTSSSFTSPDELVLGKLLDNFPTNEHRNALEKKEELAVIY